ncbi:MAG: DUF885 domain-containing protein [Actinomycetota bacterium]|nr:DUF885 domain-containing protein [Actinomycetota bacterium]
MPTPFEISDRFTEQWSDLTPIGATMHGVEGREHLWDDFSPEGEAARADLAGSARAQLLTHLNDPDPKQAFAAKVLSSWMEKKVTVYERGKWKNDLNHIYSPFQQARDVFDVMSQEGEQAWSNIATRLETFDQALEGYRATLSVGLGEGVTAAQRQVQTLIEQARALAGEESRFRGYPAEASSKGGDPDRLTAAVDRARVASHEFADWLEHTYLSGATPEDAVGEERYLLGVDDFLGLELDPHETYEWGWSEVHRLREEMRATAAEIDGSKSVEEIIDVLDTDEAHAAPDHEAFARFVQEIQDTAVQQLDGTHFDVPDPLKRVTVHLAPPGGSLGAWYHSPSEDFSRPGSIWYAPGERIRIPYWSEVSTAYHEGFPGHHLQVGMSVINRDQMSRFHRLFIWYSGSGEGWALYSERLMDELGYFEKPEYRLGLLASQLFRATRVVLDIGTQLRLAIPADAPLHAGAIWDYPIAVDYIEKVGLQPRDMAESEVKRYLGWYGQAISYKVGERVILEIRDRVMERDGAAFDRKDFHRRMLEAGAIRLDQLREAMV